MHVSACCERRKLNAAAQNTHKQAKTPSLKRFDVETLCICACDSCAFCLWHPEHWDAFTRDSGAFTPANFHPLIGDGGYVDYGSISVCVCRARGTRATARTKTTSIACGPVHQHYHIHVCVSIYNANVHTLKKKCVAPKKHRTYVRRTNRVAFMR